MKRILIAGLLGGLAVFVWGFISWAALPWHNATMPNLPNEEAVVEALRNNIAATGVYQFPGMPANEADSKAWAEKYQRGPFGVLIYTAQGTNPMSLKPFIGGLILNFITAMLVAYLLSLTGNNLAGFGQRLLFVALIGIFAALVSHISLWNWMFIPTGYSLVMAVDLVIAWVLAGLVIAWRIKPGTA
jgi:hypothetical protein